MSKTLNVFNAGEREFYVEKDGKTVTLDPKKNLEIPVKQAEKLMSMYPKELIPAGSVVDGKLDAKAYKKLEAENAKLAGELEAANAKLEDDTAALEAVIEAANTKIKELEGELEAATKPAKK